jgi:F-box/WD-40 domain protein MET30
MSTPADNLPSHFVTERRRSDDMHSDSQDSQTSFKSIFGGPTRSPETKEEELNSHQHSSHGFGNVTKAPAKLATQNVAPFLARHIPEQYAPLGPRSILPDELSSVSSKYCYRHRPDLKCRRQADEPTMDNLQRVCPSTSATYL